MPDLIDSSPRALLEPVSPSLPSIPAPVQCQDNLVDRPLHQHAPRGLQHFVYVQIQVRVTAHEHGHIVFPPAFKDCGRVDAAVVPGGRREEEGGREEVNARCDGGLRMGEGRGVCTA